MIFRRLSFGSIKLVIDSAIKIVLLFNMQTQQMGHFVFNFYSKISLLILFL